MLLHIGNLHGYLWHIYVSVYTCMDNKCNNECSGTYIKVFLLINHVMIYDRSLR